MSGMLEWWAQQQVTRPGMDCQLHKPPGASYLPRHSTTYAISRLQHKCTSRDSRRNTVDDMIIEGIVGWHRPLLHLSAPSVHGIYTHIYRQQ